MSNSTARKIRCSKRITDDGWHWYQCRYPAKFIYQSTADLSEPFCGIHAKRFKESPNLRRLEEKP